MAAAWIVEVIARIWKAPVLIVLKVPIFCLSKVSITFAQSDFEVVVTLEEGSVVSLQSLV